MERPDLREFLGQTVTLHFPNGDFTTGPLLVSADGSQLFVNGWLADSPGRFFSLNGKTYY